MTCLPIYSNVIMYCIGLFTFTEADSDPDSNPLPVLSSRDGILKLTLSSVKSSVCVVIWGAIRIGIRRCKSAIILTWTWHCSLCELGPCAFSCLCIVSHNIYKQLSFHLKQIITGIYGCWFSYFELCKMSRFMKRNNLTSCQYEVFSDI